MPQVTFKNHPKETGLASVGNPYPSIDCKIKKKIFGIINAPNWQSKDKVWTIQIMVIKGEPDDNPNCNWKWIRFNASFANPESAKSWLQENISKIMNRYTLHFFDN